MSVGFVAANAIGLLCCPAAFVCADPDGMRANSDFLAFQNVFDTGCP